MTRTKKRSSRKSALPPGVETADQLGRRIEELKFSNITNVSVFKVPEEATGVPLESTQGQIVVGDLDAEIWTSRNRLSQSELNRSMKVGSDLLQALIEKRLFEDVASGSMANPETARTIVDYFTSLDSSGNNSAFT
ncbi:hypothetical protein ABCS02_33350 [Microbacterium sp. X-17]|uniref:hypothetical protein n=1 Tax=Microbacterium sp. X-17 TaxID=3144404 RepID=UPI0031F5B8F7